MQAMRQQYKDKECSINYSEFKFSIPNSESSDIEPHIKLIRPTGLDTSCVIALDPKKGQVRTCDIRIFGFVSIDRCFSLCRFGHQALTFGQKVMI